MTYDIIEPRNRWECELGEAREVQHPHGVPGIRSHHWKALVRKGGILPTVGDIEHRKHLEAVKVP